MDSCESFLEEKRCVLCGTDAYKVVYAYPPDYYAHSEYETCSWDGRAAIPLTLVQCSHCGLIYTRPSFKADALNRVYPDDIVADVSFASTLTLAKHRTLIEAAQRYLPGRKVLMDIGTRYGALPRAAREAGYQAYGIEYNPASVQLAASHGLDYVFQGTLDDLGAVARAIGLSSVDIVVLDDVLEHLVNPVEALERASLVQRSGDGLILRQMNWNSLGRHLFGARWYYIQPAAHMYYFDPHHVKLLLDKVGYDIVEVLTPNIFEAIPKTLWMTLRQLLRPRLHAPGCVHGDKPLYLSRRWRGWHDLFTVVAVKH